MWSAGLNGIGLLLDLMGAYLLLRAFIFSRREVKWLKHENLLTEDSQWSHIERITTGTGSNIPMRGDTWDADIRMHNNAFWGGILLLLGYLFQFGGNLVPVLSYLFQIGENLVQALKLWLVLASHFYSL